jgi:hypothetical protein
MEPVSYRIPIVAYELNNNEEGDSLARRQLENVRNHLYLAANITYQHYFQLLHKNDSLQTALFEKFNKYQEADNKAKEVLNNARLQYVHSYTREEKELARTTIENLPAEMKNIRHNAKESIYAFIRNDRFIAELASKFTNIIPVDVMHHSMAKVLQELYTDYPFIQKGLQPLRVYTNSFPVCFGWNDNLKDSFSWLGDKGNGNKTVQFYLFRWLNNDRLVFKCRIGKRLPELAILLEGIAAATISYRNCGDPAIMRSGNKSWVLQFTYKPDPVPVLAKEDNTIAMGIDLGYKIPIAWAITGDGNTSGEIGNIDEIKEERNRIQAQYKKKIAAMKQTRSGQGRGRKSEVLKNKAYDERKFFRNKNAEWAHQLVDIAEKHQVAIIKIEDLDFEKKKFDLKAMAKLNNLKLTQRGVTKYYKSMPDNLLTMFRNWSYADLVTRIEKEAHQRNIMTAKVNPASTSRCCWKCGEEGVRDKQAHLRFNEEQAGACRYKSSGACVLYKYDDRTIEKQKKAMQKRPPGKNNNRQGLFTHYLMADNNAAKRIAATAQYNPHKKAK